MTYPDEMFEEAERREAERKVLDALDKLYEENGDALKRLAKHNNRPPSLWNVMRFQLGFSIDMSDEIVDAVEKWLPKDHLLDETLPYKTAVNVEEIFSQHKTTGYNDCLEEIKSNLR